MPFSLENNLLSVKMITKLIIRKFRIEIYPEHFADHVISNTCEPLFSSQVPKVRTQSPEYTPYCLTIRIFYVLNRTHACILSFSKQFYSFIASDVK